MFFSSSTHGGGWTAATRRIASLTAALFTVATIMTAVVPAAHADSSCPVGNVCLWDAAYFGGYKKVLDGQWAQTRDWIWLGTVKNSAWNRFGNRAVHTKFERDGIVQRRDCLNAGGYRLGDGNYRANYVWIGPVGWPC